MLTSRVASAPRPASGYRHDWAFVDVETSGLRAERDRVLSLAVLTAGPDGTPEAEYTTLLDPGCDPGPVHVHGLTAERLRGAPQFEQVAGRVAELLRGRVMVAHNAQFDYGFLAGEFARAGLTLPVERRLCTLTLNRRLAPPTPDLRLGTLAAHYGAGLFRAHDALEDAKALAGVLRGSLAAASALGLPLPLVACPPRAAGGHPPRIPKQRCAFLSPGRLPSGGPLVQGMKIAVTGPTATPREELVARAVAAGLNVMGSVSRHTSVLVADDAGSGSAKARRAAAEGVPVIGEREFARLLGDVRPGTPHEPVRGAEGGGPVPAPAAKRRPPAGPLGSRRVLVLGGTHPEAVAARTRVVALGGAAAVNLSATVTDVLALRGARDDRRMARIVALELPVRDPAWLDAPDRLGLPAASARRAAPVVLPRGAVIDLPVTPDTARWTVTAAWAQAASCEVDVVAFLVDEDGQVACDEDMVFYGAPETSDGAVRLSTDGPAEQTVAIDLAALPAAVRRVTVAAAIDGAVRFGDLGPIEIVAGPAGGGTPVAQATVDAATTERTLLLGELYRRGPSWRLRAVGQGYDFGLDGLARSFGVDVEE
ncbi:TerD family protein [Spirillospora sp. NBC_01491]|uniref:TerD family protein n=1 Tax=Spirillospora sp. NBC_01491 TaxID=2976007 RepID=UPI002E32D3A4|nr:TerD family protein [Spirillospora sp. NBC_01491]